MSKVERLTRKWTTLYIVFVDPSIDSTGDHLLHHHLRPRTAERLPGVYQRRGQRHRQDQGRHQVRPV